jgi:uncharacterized membrane protein YkoI
MKLKNLTITTTALFGAAMIGQAQVETERSRSATQGGLHTNEATRQNTGDVPEAATERQQQEAQAGAERARVDREAERDGADTTGTRPGSGIPGTPDASRPGNQAGAQPGERERDLNRPGLARQRDQHEPDWRGSQHEDMKLSDLSGDLQKGLRDAASGGQLDGEVTRIKYGDKEMYRGKAEIDGSEDLHIYVDGNGKLVKTQQEVELSAAPQMVRTAAERENQGRADVERVLMEMAEGKTSYIIQIDADNDRKRWIQMDETGKVMKTHEQQDD